MYTKQEKLNQKENQLFSANTFLGGQENFTEQKR